MSPLASHWRASSYAQQPERVYRNGDTTQHHSAFALVFGGVPIEDPRWRETVFEHGTDADWKNGPAARSFAADAHDRIMVRINRSYRIQVCDTKMHPMASSPRILNTQTGTVRREAAKNPLSQFIIAPRAQASKPAPGLNRGRCETQASLSGKPPSCASVSVP